MIMNVCLRKGIVGRQSPRKLVEKESDYLARWLNRWGGSLRVASNDESPKSLKGAVMEVSSALLQPLYFVIYNSFCAVGDDSSAFDTPLS